MNIKEREMQCKYARKILNADTSSIIVIFDETMDEHQMLIPLLRVFEGGKTGQRGRGEQRKRERW